MTSCAEQNEAETALGILHEQQGPFVVAVETTRMPMVFTDARVSEDPIIFANDSFLQLTGYGREDVLSRSFLELMASRTDEGMIVLIEAALKGVPEDPEVKIRRQDGSEFWASILVTPVLDGNGKILHHFISLVDLTRQYKEQARAAMFIDELNHRVKNTLATVLSIVWQAFRTGTDAGVLRDVIESRLLALSRSHDLLSASSWDGVSLRELLDSALEPFQGVHLASGRISISGNELIVPPNASLALAIVFNELATNATKYGALSAQAGLVRVSWTIAEQAGSDWLHLSWREEGGPMVACPTHKGFGSEVIERGLAYELGGNVALEFHPDGVVCLIDIPVPKNPHDK